MEWGIESIFYNNYKWSIIFKNCESLYCTPVTYMGFSGDTSEKEFACQCRRCERHRVNPWAGKIPWRRAWQPTPVFLPGESHGQRGLAGYSPQGRKESDATERQNNKQQQRAPETTGGRVRPRSQPSRLQAHLHPPCCVETPRASLWLF